MSEPTLFEHLDWRIKQWRHDRRARAVLDTPPIVPRGDGVVLFSMIGTRVVLPYLVAVKTLHQSLGMGRVALLDDGTLTAADRALLADHLGKPAITHIDDVDTGPAPRGGTWERLLTILDLRADNYVIQLDSDTITHGDVPEIRAAIAAGRSFTLLGERESTLLPTGVFVAGLPRRSGRLHVQHAIEQVMDRITVPGLVTPRYVRGCSGFAGFAPSDAGRALAEGFSQAATTLLGPERWREWGSEQVTSNFVIANEPDPLMLPYDRYLNFWNEGLPADPALVHYIGSFRFHGETYLNATRDAIRRLKR